MLRLWKRYQYPDQNRIGRVFSDLTRSGNPGTCRRQEKASIFAVPEPPAAGPAILQSFFCPSPEAARSAFSTMPGKFSAPAVFMIVTFQRRGLFGDTCRTIRLTSATVPRSTPRSGNTAFVHHKHHPALVEPGPGDTTQPREVGLTPSTEGAFFDVDNEIFSPEPTTNMPHLFGFHSGPMCGSTSHWHAKVRHSSGQDG